MDSILENLIKEFLTKDSFDEQVSALNELREIISTYSPFNSEPVDFVRWVSINDISANDYNPNTVAPPEMELLRISIASDGYTQPIVANDEDGVKVVVDGFHRNRVGREIPEIKEKLHGYLPIVQIRAQQTNKADRMASTIRHNRARGKHQVVAMSDIVLDLKRRNWSDEKIARELGMDSDEVLRLAQITGLAEAFKNREFSKSWEAIIQDEVEDLEESINA